LRRCATEMGMQPINIHGYAFNSNYPFLDHLTAEEMAQHQHVFRTKGYLYGPFGGMIEGIPELERYKVLLMIRDPRDILVSQYYSVAYSHPPPDRHGNKFEAFIKKRYQAKALTIDEYVITESDYVYNNFVRYKTLLLDVYPETCIITYENMVDNFAEWLGKILACCDLKISSGLINTLVEEAKRLRPQTENIHKHLRKGVAGDYMNQLKPETIIFLNDKLSPILDAFGYKRLD